jgi:hypothetical protein
MISKQELEVSFLRKEANGEIKRPSFAVVRRDIARCIEVMNEIEQKMKNKVVLESKQDWRGATPAHKQTILQFTRL